MSKVISVIFSCLFLAAILLQTLALPEPDPEAQHHGGGHYGHGGGGHYGHGGGHYGGHNGGHYGHGGGHQGGHYGHGGYGHHG